MVKICKQCFYYTEYFLCSMFSVLSSKIRDHDVYECIDFHVFIPWMSVFLFFQSFSPLLLFIRHRDRYRYERGGEREE